MDSRKDDNWKIGDLNLNWLKNKYILAALIFCLWVLFFDQNNLVERYQLMREMKQLADDRLYYIQKTAEDTERLKELKTNDENLEKFAREQYYMKRDNEEVFVIVQE
jgi:cell division protein FtsB